MSEPPPYEVRLRPVSAGDMNLLSLWRSSAVWMGDFNDFGLPYAPPTEEMVKTGGLRGEQGGTLMVELLVAGTPIGTVTWRQVRYGPNPESRAWNIGISLIPEMRGRGFGSQAQRRLAEYLFATTSFNRVEATTDVENFAEQRALVKAGFSREGVLRGAQYRAGEWHDLVVYSAVRRTETKGERT